MPILEDQDGRAYYQLSTMQGNFPTYATPHIIGDAIVEASTNLGVPIELAAQAALGVVSLACQNLINVRCPNFDPAPVALFLMGSDDSGHGKTPVQQRFLPAVWVFERKQEEEAEAKLSIFRAELKIWLDDDRRLAKDYRGAEPGSEDAESIRQKRLRHEQNRPVEPKPRQLRYAELSPQGLRDTLLANGATAIVAPEAWTVVNGLTFSQSAPLNSYWSGEDRPVGLAGGNRRPVEPRLTISVMLQGAKFMDYMKSRGRDAFDTGLLQRFLVVAPQSDHLPLKQTCIDDVPEPKLVLFNERAAQVLNQAVPAPRDRLVLNMSDRAKHYWKVFKDGINFVLTNEGYSDEINAFFRKLAQQASRIAALFHYFEGKSGDISSEAMKSAIVLCEWYAHEYVRIFTPYAPSQQQKDTETSQKLLEWLEEAVEHPRRYSKLTPGQYTERDLNNYSALRGNPRELANAIDMLYRQGLISVMHGKKGGRLIIYLARNSAVQSQPFYYPQQAAVNAATNFMTPSNIPSSISSMHNGQNNQAQAACVVFDQGPNQAHLAIGDERNFVTGTNSGIDVSQQTMKGGSESTQPDRGNVKEKNRADLETVKRNLTEMAMKAFTG
jgi:hypothetical protein